ncbi:MAG: ATP-binding cassette domain-containing protein [Chitinophagaceae bacterium]
MNKEENAFKKILNLIRLERYEIRAIYSYAVLNGLIQLSLPLGIQGILAFVLGVTISTSVYILIGVVILGVLVMGYFQINQMKLIEIIQQKLFVRYGFAFAETIPKLDFKEIDNYYLPEKINHFFDVINLQKGISKLLLDIPSALIQIFFGLIILSLYHPLFFVFAIVLFIALYVLFKLTIKKGLESSIEESNYKYKVVAWLEELGRVIKSIKYSQGTNLNLIKTDEKILNYLYARTTHFNVLLFQFKCLLYFKVCITAIMLILGSYLLYSQKINVGQFVAAEIIIITVINSLEKLIKRLESVYDVATGIYKLDFVLESNLEKDGKILFTSAKIDIEIKDLDFSYNEAQNVLNNVAIKIPASSITCISGEENSGKSTLLKLLTGSYPDFQGMILLNDIPIQNYTFQSLRNITGVFLNEQELFDGTVYENITLGKNDISTEQIVELSKAIGFDNFITNFQYGLYENIDPLGKKLPSSLVRKILILRSLIHNPLLLLLEEPWVGLEVDTKQKLQQYLIDLSKNKTIVIATNDSNFTMQCSNTIYLSKGNVTAKK